MSVGLLMGCGDKTTEAPSEETKEEVKEVSASKSESDFVSASLLGYDVDDYVTLGDYKNIEVSLDYSYEVSEANIREAAQYYITYFGGFTKTDEEEVLADSIVNVDYTGYKDGVAFDGGAATDVMLDIANNGDAMRGTGFIDGFTSGLVGAKVGDEIDCDVTFPANYGAADLAGAQVVLHFKINYIAKAQSLDEITDEEVVEYFGSYLGINNKDEFLSYMEGMITSYYQSSLREAVRTKINDICTVNSIPEGYEELRMNELIDYIKASMLEEGQTFEEYLQANYNMDEAAFREAQAANIRDEVEEELRYEAIAKAEGLTMDEAAYNEYMENYVAQQGFASRDELFATIGKDAADGEKYFRQIYFENEVVTHVMDLAKVVFVDALY